MADKIFKGSLEFQGATGPLPYYNISSNDTDMVNYVSVNNLDNTVFAFSDANGKYYIGKFHYFSTVVTLQKTQTFTWTCLSISSLECYSGATSITGSSSDPTMIFTLTSALSSTYLKTAQTTKNKVNSFQSTPDDTHYPSEKLVYDELTDIRSAISTLDYRTWKGVATVSEINGMSSSSLTNGDIYQLSDSGTITNPDTSTVSVVAGDNIAWNGSKWQKINSNYVTYTGATQNVDLGTRSIAANSYYVNSIVQINGQTTSGDESAALGFGTYTDDSGWDCAALRITASDNDGRPFNIVPGDSNNIVVFTFDGEIVEKYGVSYNSLDNNEYLGDGNYRYANHIDCHHEYTYHAVYSDGSDFTFVTFDPIDKALSVVTIDSNNNDKVSAYTLPLRQGFVVMDAPSSTTLSSAQSTIIRNNNVVISGTYLNLSNPVLLKPTTTMLAGAVQGIIMAGNKIGLYTVTTDLQTQVTTISANVYAIPDKPSSSGTFTLKSVDGVLTWVAG